MDIETKDKNKGVINFQEISWIKKNINDLFEVGDLIYVKKNNKNIPDLFNKSIATCLHISDVASPSPTKCLFSIPVRDNIQSFEVSTIFSKSVFVSVLSGRYFAVTVILAFNLVAPNDH